MWNFFIRNYKFTNVLIISFIVFGVISVVQIPKESNPEIDIPIAVISTVFPGATAIDVEEFVTDVVEDKILSLDEVDEITSVSRTGLSLITVSFDANSNGIEKLADLKDKVDQAKSSLPEDVKDPLVQKISFSDRPILTLSLSGPFDLPQLKEYATELQDEIERVSGVSKVNVIGGQEREVQVIINRALLEGYGLSIGQITQAISQANSDIPIGSIETANEIFTLRFAGKISNAEEVRNIPITSLGNTPILVRDIAEVIDGYKEVKSISRLSTNDTESMPSVSLKIFKVSGGNVLDTVDAVHETAEDAKVNFLPESIIVATTEDNALQIRNDLTDLTKNGIATIIIVMSLLFLFLGWREALLAGLAVPLTFFITFGILLSLGYTLNMLTLFSLILSLGILVDSSIVVTEAMHILIKKGKTAKEAAFETIKEFKMPIISGTLTTIFAFLPLMLTSGIIGKFIKSIPISISIILLTSLFVALGIITTLGVTWLKREELDSKQIAVLNNNGDKDRREQFFNFIQGKYEKILNIFLFNKKYKLWFWSTIILLFVVSLSLPITGLLKVNMFPESNLDTFYVDIEAPIGTIIEDTNKYITEVEDVVQKDNRVESILVNVGSSANSGSVIEAGGVSDTHLAHIIVNLKKERKEKSGSIVREYQDEVAKLFSNTIIKSSVTQQSSGPGDSAPVEVVISGDEFAILESLGIQFENLLKDIPGTVNIQTNVQESNGEFVVYVDRIKAQLYGISTAQLASTLRNGVFGSEATSIRENGEDIAVLVKYKLDSESEDVSKTNKVNIGAINSLTISTVKGDIPLSAFVSTKLEGGQSVIEHKDGARVVRVTSHTKDGIQAQEIFNAIDGKMSDVYIPSGYSVVFGGEREDIQKSFSDMFRAMIFGVFMIAGLLVWQFRSYRQPLFILVTIPLALIGVFLGLFIIGKPLSFPGFIGIVALAGIVVNNAIVLIDRINKNRISGLSVDNAIIEASKSRLQPILLTSITTISGLLPLAITNPTWGPLGYSIAFGLFFAVFLTLLAVPLLYHQFGEKDIMQ